MTEPVFGSGLYERFKKTKKKKKRRRKKKKKKKKRKIVFPHSNAFTDNVF